MRTLFALLLSAAGLMAQTVETIPFRTVLLPSNEVPPVTGVNATGAGTVWVHVVRDASGNITSGSIDFQADVTFPGAVTINGFHIHRAPAGQSGDIVISTGLGAGNTVAIDASGKGQILRQVQFGTGSNQPGVDVVRDLIANPQNFYLNIHTSDNPAGVIRGQLVRADMIVLMGLMSTANENPPIANSNAAGVATVVLLRTRGDGGAVNSGYAIFNLNYTGFPADTTFTGFHIHTGGASVNGPVVLNTGIGGGANAVAVGPSGSGTLHREFEVNIASTASLNALNALFDSAPENLYINAHTPANPGGEIRAQLRRTSSAQFQINLMTANEVPPVNINASAPSAFTLYTLRNADGTVAAGTAIFDVNPRFPASTTFTGLHIHSGPAGQNGPIVIESGVSGGGNSVTFDTGNGNIYRIVTVSSQAGIDALNGILRSPDRFYMNLHTTDNPGGSARAQLAAANTLLGSIGAVTSNPLTTVKTLAPGEIFTIYGQNLARVTSDLSGFSGLTTLPPGLNGVTVTVAGIAAPLYYVSATQINAQVPLNAPAGSQPVVVTTVNGASAAFNVTIAAAAPAIYVDPVSGIGAILKNSDFSVITPANPAAVGDIVLIYATGLGQTTPSLITGGFGSGAPFQMTAPVTVAIGGQNADVIYSIASPGFAGLYQTAVRIPAGVSGTVPVVLSLGNAASNTVNITVR